jgi:hypothetical protein
MGLTQGGSGSGNYNDPLTISLRAQRQDHSTLLLMPRRRGGRWQITRGDPAQAPLGTQAGSTTPRQSWQVAYAAKNGKPSTPRAWAAAEKLLEPKLKLLFDCLSWA